METEIEKRRPFSVVFNNSQLFIQIFDLFSEGCIEMRSLLNIKEVCKKWKATFCSEKFSKMLQNKTFSMGNLFMVGKWSKGELVFGCRLDEKKSLLWTGEFKNGKEWKGEGTLMWSDAQRNKWKYVGELEEGEPQGSGEKFDISENKLVWKGRWKRGSPWEGEGTCVLIDSRGNNFTFEGKIFAGKPEGKGKKRDIKGELVWSGDWMSGSEWTGEGNCLWSDEGKIWSYKGILKRGFPHGKGKVVEEASGEVVWKGEWKDGVPWTGNGTWRWKDREGEWMFEGPLFEGNPDGKGVLFNASTKFSGSFFKGIKIGNGMLMIGGKEYFVEFDSQGQTIKKERTFAGLRLMVRAHF